MLRLKNIFYLGIITSVLLLASCGGDDGSDNQPAPSISGFTPTSGAIGATVTISGNNFSTTIANNQVKFGAINATVTGATATSITTTVPAGASTGKISVTVNGQTAISTTDFTINPAPSIASFTPTSGSAGTVVTITGNNFSAVAAQNIVTFNGTTATVTAATATSIITTVPAGASTGKINVTVNGQTAVSTTDFIVNLSPSITSFSPTSGTAGTVVTITGNNFSTTASENVVAFNGATATVTAASATSLTVTLPNNATSGKITVQVGSLSGTSAIDFSATPSITSFSPISGTSGATVTITGTNFPSLNNLSVLLNTVVVNVSAVTATSITFTVPANATTGKITVSAPGQNVISTTDFTVVPQVITILPSSGGIGETINITGTGFSSVAANNVVKFNNVTATVNSVSFSLGLMMLSTTVPAGATTGQLTIQVNGGTVINSGDFQVLSGTWTSKAIFPGNTRMGAVGFSIGNKGYIGTGRDASNAPVKEFWEFDPATNVWSQKADFAGTARWNAVGFGIGSKGYIGTGDDGTATGSNIRNDFWEYDPATNVWTERANFGGSARMNATGFSIGTKGYIGTGITSLTLFTRVNDFWEYDPATNTWIQRANVGPTGRGSAKGFTIGTRGYIVGGEQSLERQDTWEYNPTNNTWTQRASHPTTVGTSSIRSSTAVGFTIGAKGYICTGDTGRTCIEYDPSTNLWKQVASLVGDGRNFAVGFSIGSKGYLGLGGFTSVRFNSFHEFTP